MQTENNIYHAYTISHFVAGKIFVTQPARRVACVATMFVNTIVALLRLQFEFGIGIYANDRRAICVDNMSHVT